MRFIILGLFLFSFQNGNAIAGDVTGLYDIFEISVTNNKPYSNPFNFDDIELEATFIAPSGGQIKYFGFYDGDGFGHNTGNTWKIRFSPNELGEWKFSYRWTDGSPGASGRFQVIDTGLPGPLGIARDNPWYFEDSRGKPFHARGYSLHQYLEGKYGRGVFKNRAIDDLIDKIEKKVADRRYNLLMLAWPVFTNKLEYSFWQSNDNALFKRDTPNFSRFNIQTWKNVERIIEAAAKRKVYIFQFVALVDQYSDRPEGSDMENYLKYMSARLGVYWNNLGYSPTWEFHEIWNINYANKVMSELHKYLGQLPIPPLLSIHDHSNSLFDEWLDFSMKQNQARTIFDGNCRSCGKNGGVTKTFLNQPIIGSEDNWEYNGGKHGQPRNGIEVRRGVWGSIMAGVMPIYSEVGLTESKAPNKGKSNFSGEGEPEVRRMYDFYYSKTRYRQYQQLNEIVSKAERQICSGIRGKEYLIYDEDGGPITIDLSDTPSSTRFNVLWYNPFTGRLKYCEDVVGGGIKKMDFPLLCDCVLLLKQISVDIH
jgi:hypothetical protein